MSDSFYLRTKYYTITEDGFMHKHQASLDSQREEAEINWLFPEDDEEIEDKDFPYEEEDYETF